MCAAMVIVAGGVLAYVIGLSIGGAILATIAVLKEIANALAHLSYRCHCHWPNRLLATGIAAT